MGNEKHCPAEGGQHLFEIGGDFHIQVVRGLIQKEDIGTAAEHRCQFQARFFATGENIHRRVKLLLGKAHPL